MRQDDPRGTTVETHHASIAAPTRIRDAQLIAVTDRLLNEYGDAPTIAVVRAVREARRTSAVLRAFLDARGGPGQAGVVLAPPELVGARARGMLTPWGHIH